MPYLPVELDALNKFPHVAAAAGVVRACISDGMLYLWAHVFREKTDVVTLVHIKGFFGHEVGQAVADAMEAFGFLEAIPDRPHAYRVKGAQEKLLSNHEARSRGGHAAKGNLIPGGPNRKKPSRGPAEGGADSADLGSAQAPAEPQPSPADSADPRLSSALTPNTQHPTPNTTTTTTAPPPSKSDPVSAVGGMPVPSVVAGARPERRVALRVEPPDKPPDEWTGDDFWRWFQHLRQKQGYAAEKRPPPLGGWWNSVMMELRGNVERMQEAVFAFGRDPHWEARGYPWAAFVDQLHKYLRLEKRDAS